MKPSLTRSTSDKFAAGVCGGIARWLGVEAWIVRVVFVAALLLGSASLWLYIVLWLVLPSDAGKRGYEDVRDTFSSHPSGNPDGSVTANPDDLR
ncbi:MAG: PspC domain-containing protein [Propionibacteriaceae bacterium]|jgi:phage shock protein PspC (stress-responsive transcriptional regulator)|nr:PspC domain-containing protein [Propionibacteriaceae bacterium]